MALNGNRPTYRAEDTATSPIAVSERVKKHLRAQQCVGETIDDTLRRLLELEPRQRLSLVGSGS